MCGNNSILDNTSCSRWGSPPHVREQPDHFCQNAVPFRFTPACAGTTDKPVKAPPLSRVHPRMCGNNQYDATRERINTGSPPHVREQRSTRCDPPDIGGFTPACAGTTRASRCTSQSAWVHPRMCGNNNDTLPCSASSMGSPPHVREQLFGINGVATMHGFTPACAGTTCFCDCHCCVLRVHPRMCGNN